MAYRRRWTGTFGDGIPFLIIVGRKVMPLWPIVRHALVFGAILSGVLFTLTLAVARFNPEIMLKDYPPDIQAKYGPMSARSKRQRIPVALAFGAILVGLVTLSFRGLQAMTSDDISFLPAFVHLFVMFSLFNLLDWLILDWLIVVTLRPRFIILPGTEEMAGYASYGFHFRGFVIGSVIIVVTGLAVAGIVAIFA
jgi:hypothetical protein